MSQENVEIVQGAFAEFERGNFWVPEIFDPGVRVVWLSAIVGGELETVGVDELTRTMKEWMQSWEHVTSVPERFIDAGDRVVVIAEWRGRGRTSGVFTNLRYGTVLTLREAKITSMISYTDPAEALEAAGLRE